MLRRQQGGACQGIRACQGNASTLHDPLSRWATPRGQCTTHTGKHAPERAAEPPPRHQRPAPPWPQPAVRLIQEPATPASGTDVQFAASSWQSLYCSTGVVPLQPSCTRAAPAGGTGQAGQRPTGAHSAWTACWVLRRTRGQPGGAHCQPQGGVGAGAPAARGMAGGSKAARLCGAAPSHRTG